MPLIDEKPVFGSLTNLAAPPDDDTMDPSLVDTLGAAFRTQNMIGSFLASRGQPDPYQIEDGYDSIQDFVDSGLEEYVDEAAGIFNRKAGEAKKAQIRRELQDRRILDAAGGKGLAAEIGAGFLDLPTLLPFGGGLAVGVGRTAVRVGVGAGLDAGLSEAGLQATQETRTLAESAVNIGGSIVLGGALGALAGRYLSPDQVGDLSRRIENQSSIFDEADKAFVGAGQSAGAAARDVGPLVLKDERLIKALPGVNIQDPLIRSQLSTLNVTREAVRRLAETPLEYADNAKGIATERGGAVETRIKMWNAPTAQALRDIDTTYAKYFNNVADPSSWQVRLSPAKSEIARRTGGQKLTYKQFKEEVGRAAFSGEQHMIPEVAEAARFYRQWDDALKEAAIDARIFSPDVAVEGDVSHLFRMYDQEKIIARRDVWTQRLVDYLTSTRDRAAKAADEAAAAGQRADTAARKVDEFANLSDGDIRSIVDEITDTILGNGSGRLPFDGIVAGPRGPLKSRTLKIESEKIADFMDLDIESVMRAQIRTMAPDIEIARKFGTADMAEEIRKINDEANARIAAAKSDAERKALQKQRVDDIRDIEGIRDRLRGNYALPSNPRGLVTRVARVVRNLNYIRLLGGMTLSAIPDMAKVVFTHGLTSTFKDGFVPLLTSFKSVKLAGREVQAAGTALDMILDSRTMAMADIMDDFGRGSKFERGLSSLSSKFGMVSLMAPWNSGMKQFAGMVTMTNLMRASKRLAEGKASPGEIRRLAASGIDEDLAIRINRQFGDHGEVRGGVWLPQTGAWTDKAASEAVRAAIVRDVDRIIVTPGQDKPLWMSTELGKMVGQFKSFSVSSMQRTLLAGLQQRDAATLNGTMLMLGLGAFTYGIKEMAAGRETSDDPSVWAVNALDRSGLTGWLMEVNNIAEKATRGRVGLSAISGEQVSRYATRNIYGAFLGPSADAVADIFQVSGSIFAGDTTKSDLRRARQLIPAQNLFYVRSLFDKVEEATGNALNLPDTRRQ